MKVSMDKYGYLHIEAETPIECYALGKWLDGKLDHDNLSTKWIIIKTDIDDESCNKQD